MSFGLINTYAGTKNGDGLTEMPFVPIETMILLMLAKTLNVCNQNNCQANSIPGLQCRRSRIERCQAPFSCELLKPFPTLQKVKGLRTMMAE